MSASSSPCTLRVLPVAMLAHTPLWWVCRYVTSLYSEYGANSASSAGFASGSYQGTTGVPPYTLYMLSVRACSTLIPSPACHPAGRLSQC